MLFVSELLTYLFKAVILGAIAVVGILCGAKLKKSKADNQSKEQKEA